MSIRDMNPEDDAKLEAFLRKEDELSKLLQELPQPQPSAELDAAILADAEAALARDGAARVTPVAQGAANDAAFPGGALRPSFLSRWKLPLSMAAAALLTVSLVWMQHGGPTGDGPIQVAQAPALEAAIPAPAAAPAPAAVPAPQPSVAPQPKDELKLAEADAARKPAVQPKALAKQAARKKQADGPADSQPDSQPTQLAQADQLPPQAQTQASPKAYAAPEPTVIAKADIADTPEPAARNRIVTRSILAAPAAPAPPPAMASGAQAQAEAKAEMRAAEARMATARKESSVMPPRLWLKRIEEKIAAGSQREALEEWAKFRKAYPDYEVPKALREKIDNLKK